MEQYAIKGGNPLVGEVEIGGAKNAALPILAASVMTDETVYIENMPDVRDTNVLLSAMENIGVIVKRTDRHKVTLNASNISELVVEDENIKKIRASYYLIGALLVNTSMRKWHFPVAVISAAVPSTSILRASVLWART